MGKKASWNPIEALTDALDDVLSGNIFDVSDPKVPEVKANGVEGNTTDVGDGSEPEPGDGDGTEAVVKPVKSRAKPSKRSETKGKAAGSEESADAGESADTE
jgi:hypothetical protein